MTSTRGISRATDVRSVGSRTPQAIAYHGYPASGWWIPSSIDPVTSVAAYQAKGAATLAASYINLVNPGVHNASLGVAPAWDVVNGWKGNGSSVFLNTGIIPKNKNYTTYIRITGNTGSWGAGLISFTSGKGLGIIFTPSGVRLYHGGYGTVSTIYTDGVLCMAGNKFYVNGISVDSPSAYGLTPTNQFTLLGCPVDGDWFNGYLQAAAIYNVIHSPDQVLSVNNSMAEL